MWIKSMWQSSHSMASYRHRWSNIFIQLISDGWIAHNVLVPWFSTGKKNLLKQMPKILFALIELGIWEKGGNVPNVKMRKLLIVILNFVINGFCFVIIMVLLCFRYLISVAHIWAVDNVNSITQSNQALDVCYTRSVDILVRRKWDE